MTAASEASEAHRAGAYRPAWLTAMLGVAVSCALAWWFWREAVQVDSLRFSAAVTNLVEHLDTRTERYAEQLERLADFLAGQESISTGMWTEFLDRLAPASNLPAFVELAYATNTASFSRADIAEKQKQPLALFEAPQTDIEIARHWTHSVSVLPEETKQWLWEWPVFERRRKIFSGRLSSSPARPLRGPSGEPLVGVSLFVPVFFSDLAELAEFSPPSHLAQLREFRCKGVVIGTIDWKQFLKTAMPAGAEQVAFEAFAGIDDGQPLRSETWMSSIGKSESQVLKPGFQPRFRHQQSWPFYRTRWQLVFYSTDLFDKRSTRYRAWVALGGGVVLSGLMGGLLAVQVRARLNQERIAAQLQAALDDLGAARKERERLSHDLHDGAIQSLYAMQLSLSRAADLAEAAQPILGRRLGEIRRNLSAVIGELRGFILRHEAKPEPAGDLASVLTAQIERLRHSTGASLVARVSPSAGASLPGEQAVHLANLAREAISNAVRHARAKQILVVLRQANDTVVLQISDDGCGFEPEHPPGKGMGLTSMAARARQAGGELRIESHPGGGTRVTVSVLAVAAVPPGPA